MSASDPKIDLIELADLGQPRKIALEIHRQLRSQYGEVPRRVPLEGIAKAVGIVDIVDFDTDRFEGTLVIKGDRGAIGLRRGLHPGRRNFTLGHELGHFLNPWHRKFGSRFECNKEAVKAVRTPGFDKKPALERLEVEANEFSATLLVPLPEYRATRQSLGRDIDVAHIRMLADIFGVSQEFMARIYVDQTDSKIAIIHSHNGVIQRYTLPRDFPFLGLRKGAPLPSESLSYAFRAEQVGATSELREIRTSAWLERRGSVAALYEQVLIQKDGWMTTLLAVDEDEEDDEENDSNWNRRNHRR